MNCPVCGAPLLEAGAGPVCARCSLAQALNPSEATPAPEGLLDGYEVMHLLGRGAMGVVWLARERRLDRLVAVKVIATDAHPALAHRLQREGQAVARLRHPHIVAVHALGGSGASTFLAMDFLSGGNLQEHLHGQPMAPRKAAEMTAKLAGALAHAHAEGILHRDLKPSNILLDASGEPHLADFGLAAPLEGATDLTQLGQFAGTPGYLAPELAAGSDSASERSDVYGLGAVFYHCLAGRSPFLAESPGALFRQLAEADPVPPRLIQPGISRDLETICLKCLEKAPARRYPTAQALAEDLQRYLRGEPVLARPAGPAGKLLRWCSRRPGAATAVGLAAVIVLILAIGGPLVALHLDRSRRAAETAASRATAITDFLEKDLLSQASPANQPDRDLKLRTVLDAAATKVATRFADRPEIESELQETLGETYYYLGVYPEALQHLQRALELRERREPWGSETVHSMGIVGCTCYLMGDPVKGEAYLQRAVAISRAHLPPTDFYRAAVLNDLGILCLNGAKVDQAEPLFRECLRLRQQVVGLDDNLVLVALNNVANIDMRKGNYPEALASMEKILPVRQRLSGTDHPETVTVMNNIAFLRYVQGDPRAAEPLYRQALAISRRVSGPEHIVTLNVMQGLAEVCRAEGRLAEAEQLLRDAVAIETRAFGQAHPATVRESSSLGEVYLEEAKFAEAESLLRGAGEASVQAHALPWKVAIIHSRLGAALAGQRRFDEAAPILTEATRTLERDAEAIPVPNRPEIAQARARLAALTESRTPR